MKQLLPVALCSHPHASLVYVCEWIEMAPHAPSMHTCADCGTSLQLIAPVHGQEKISFADWQRRRREAHDSKVAA